MAKDTATSFVSIHAARAGSDHLPDIGVLRGFWFQSTLPARAATRGTDPSIGSIAVSIHAARAGSDACCAPSFAPATSFNPRCPRGQRRCTSNFVLDAEHVSIHAARAGSDPRSPREAALADAVSIHAPARGATDGAVRYWHEQAFQSTLPRGERHYRIGRDGACQRVSIHAARAGSDQLEPLATTMPAQFQSTLPRGQRRCGYRCSRSTCFNPRCPRGERPEHLSQTLRSLSFNPRSPRGQRP